jgi:homoserine kinase type II
MARYTQLTDRDAYAIADAYGLKIIRWQPIAGGYENSSFLLNADQGDYVLTFYEKKSIAGAEYNVQLLNHLAEHGYQTNKVVNTIDGNLISAYRGKPLVLKTWIPGATLRDTVQADYRSIGRAVAKLHNIPAPDFLSQEHPYGLRSMPASLGHQGDHEFEDWLEAKLGYILSNFPAGLTKTLIHSDLFDDNIIFHRGQFQAIIDFGEACFHPRAYDLGSVLNGACM